MVSAKDCIDIHLHVQVHASLFPCSSSVELLGEARINNITKAIADYVLQDLELLCTTGIEAYLEHGPHLSSQG